MDEQKKEKEERRIGSKSLRIDILILSLLPIFILGGEIIAVIYTFLNKKVDSSFFHKILKLFHLVYQCCLRCTFVEID